MYDQSRPIQIDIHFPVFRIRVNDVDVTRISSHWSAWFTWVLSPLTFGVLDSCESPHLSRSGCLIHVSSLISHVRKWMRVCFVKLLNVRSEHHSLRYKHLLYFESNWLLRRISSARKDRIAYSTNHIVPRSRTFVIDQIFYPFLEIIIKNGEIWCPR